MTTLTRRTAITAALATAAAPAVAAMPTSGDDAELIALGEQIDPLLPEYVAAFDAEWDASWRAHLKMREQRRELRLLAKRNSKLWEKAFQAIYDECGHTAASHRTDAVDEQINPLFERLTALRPTTPRGLAVQARAVALYSARNLWSSDDYHNGQIRTVIESACRLGGASLAELTDRATEA